MATQRPMWVCPTCARSFASSGQVHSCGMLGSLNATRQAMTPLVGEIFDEFVAVVKALGPVEILPEQTRIAFHARMSFAVVVPRRRWLNGHLVLAEAVEDHRFRRVTSYSAHDHVHEFRLTSPGEIDSTMRRRIAAAYEVGLQHHHRE